MSLASGSARIAVALDAVRAGATLAGKYRIEREIGRGGMGVVFSARHLKLEQPVAIKVLSKDMIGQPIHVERFMREARAASQVRSEHVVRVMDVDVTSEGTPYIVMERLEGSDLASVLSKRGPLGVEESVDYLLQTCEALAAAHALGIVHRDLKTANLFLTRGVDGTDCIKVLDFGICKLTESQSPVDREVTEPELLGSPSYMSPEQLRDAPNIDARTDVWAIGMVAFRLLTRQQPFVGKTIFALYEQILHEPPRTLRQFKPELPAGLEAVVLRCLQKRPEARFADVADLAVGLYPFASRSAQKRVARIARILDSSGKRPLSKVNDIGTARSRPVPIEGSVSEIRELRHSALVDALAPRARIWDLAFCTRDLFAYMTRTQLFMTLGCLMLAVLTVWMGSSAASKGHDPAVEIEAYTTRAENLSTQLQPTPQAQATAPVVVQLPKAPDATRARLTSSAVPRTLARTTKPSARVRSLALPSARTAHPIKKTTKARPRRGLELFDDMQ